MRISIKMRYFLRKVFTMSMYLAQNLKYLRKQHGFNQELVAERLGLTATAYGAYERGDTQPPIAKLMTIVQLFDVSMDDICNRKAEDFLDDFNTDKELESLDIFRVKVVPYRVQAGYLTNFTNPDFYEGFEEIYVPDPGVGRRNTMKAFEVRGDSMLPRIQQDDFVVCREFPLDVNLENYTNRIFVVVTRESEFLVKRLDSFDSEAKKGVFVSDNKSLYKEKIPLNFVDEVAQLWKVEYLMGKER